MLLTLDNIINFFSFFFQFLPCFGCWDERNTGSKRDSKMGLRFLNRGGGRGDKTKERKRRVRGGRVCVKGGKKMKKKMQLRQKGNGFFRERRLYLEWSDTCSFERYIHSALIQLSSTIIIIIITSTKSESNLKINFFPFRKMFSCSCRNK